MTKWKHKNISQEINTHIKTGTGSADNFVRELKAEWNDARLRNGKIQLLRGWCVTVHVRRYRQSDEAGNIFSSWRRTIHLTQLHLISTTYVGIITNWSAIRSQWTLNKIRFSKLSFQQFKFQSVLFSIHYALATLCRFRPMASRCVATAFSIITATPVTLCSA